MCRGGGGGGGGVWIPYDFCFWLSCFFFIVLFLVVAGDKRKTFSIIYWETSGSWPRLPNHKQNK